jgi:hypothetical protein
LKVSKEIGTRRGKVGTGIDGVWIVGPFLTEVVFCISYVDIPALGAALKLA